jgi:GrpB-like predicted nucleotidyltransferase (UPF0157 family)
MAIQLAVAVGDLSPVQFRPYETAWPERFAIAKDLVCGALGGYAVRVEHIGSTAVPELPGRPQLDIQVSVAEPDAEEDYRWLLEELGFTLWIREADRRVFHARPGALPVHAPACETFVYVCSSGGVWEHDQLLLAAYLNAHPIRRDQYAELKGRVAREHRHDPAAYAEAKRPFLRETIKLAQRAYR